MMLKDAERNLAESKTALAKLEEQRSALASQLLVARTELERLEALDSIGPKELLEQSNADRLVTKLQRSDEELAAEISEAVAAQSAAERDFSQANLENLREQVRSADAEFAQMAIEMEARAVEKSKAIQALVTRVAQLSGGSRYSPQHTFFGSRDPSLESIGAALSAWRKSQRGIAAGVRQEERLRNRQPQKYLALPGPRTAVEAAE